MAIPIHIANAASRAGCPLIVPSDEVIASFASDPSCTWDGLYMWLVREHGVAPHGLHNRTRVGDATMKKLLKVERKLVERYIRRKGYSGSFTDAVNDALARSYGSASPQEVESETDRKLTGEGLFVLPQEPEDVPAEEEPDP
jgi:hypothetical protein